MLGYSIRPRFRSIRQTLTYLLFAVILTHEKFLHRMLAYGCSNIKKVVIEQGLPFDPKLPAVEHIPAKRPHEVSVQEYIALLCQVPKGKITRNEDINAFLAAKYGTERVEICYASLPDNLLWEGIPWWRVVSTRGMLYDQMFHPRDEQRKLLEMDGLRIVPCGAYGKSLKVERYKELLFKDYQ